MTAAFSVQCLMRCFTSSRLEVASSSAGCKGPGSDEEESGDRVFSGGDWEAGEDSSLVTFEVDVDFASGSLSLSCVPEVAGDVEVNEDDAGPERGIVVESDCSTEEFCTASLNSEFTVLYDDTPEPEGSPSPTFASPSPRVGEWFRSPFEDESDPEASPLPSLMFLHTADVENCCCRRRRDKEVAVLSIERE